MRVLRLASISEWWETSQAAQMPNSDSAVQAMGLSGVYGSWLVSSWARRWTRPPTLAPLHLEPRIGILSRAKQAALTSRALGATVVRRAMQAALADRALGVIV